MQCERCAQELGSDEEVFFFSTAEHVHLSMKPERRTGLDARLVAQPESRKKRRLHCAQCEHTVGVEVPYGPDGVWFPAFSSDETMLRWLRLSKLEKWASMRSDPAFVGIETRG
jgi:hypothetical protein